MFGHVKQDCQSSNKEAWTNNNALSCSDNKACTRNDRCSSGTCAGTPFTCLSCEVCANDACSIKAGWCVIQDGGARKCFSHGTLRPGYPCQVMKMNTHLAISWCGGLRVPVIPRYAASV